MTVDASRSCLGLATSVGSAIRQIVDARVLLAAAAPPSLARKSHVEWLASGSYGCDRRSCAISLSSPSPAGRWPTQSLTVRGRSRRSEEHTSELQSRGHLVCRL